jgi:hypothetical protein
MAMLDSKGLKPNDQHMTDETPPPHDELPMRKVEPFCHTSMK